MPQSFAQIIVHLVFSTKERRCVISEEIAPKLHAYLAGILKEQGCQAIAIGGMEDHVHILCGLSKKTAPVRIVEEIKKSSSKWMKTQGDAFESFQWQRGYGMFSVSPTHLASAEQYVRNQEEHHRTKTFQEELREFLRRYRIDYDEQYVWD